MVVTVVFQRDTIILNAAAADVGDHNHNDNEYDVWRGRWRWRCLWLVPLNLDKLLTLE